MSKKEFSSLLILFSFFAFSNYSFSHKIKTDSLPKTVTLNSDSTQLLQLNNNDEFLNIRINTFLLDNFSDTLLLQLKIDYLIQNYNSQNIFNSSMSEQWRIDDQLTNYIQFQKRMAIKSDLGVFGEVLNHSRNLTAIILAIVHIIKYRKSLY